MKQFVLFVLLCSIVMAQPTCDPFVQQAEDYITNPVLQEQLPYPIDFAIAQEYFHAAECFEQANKEQALINYDLASNHYLIALQALDEGTDYSLKARTYEKAALSNQKLGKTDLALDYYQRAAENYRIIGMMPEAEHMMETMHSLETIPETTTQEIEQPKDYTQAFLSIGLVIIVLPLIYLLLTFFERGKNSISSIKMPKRKSIKHKKLEPKPMEHPRSAPMVKEKTDRSKKAREKLKHKLRSKYKR